MTFSSLAFLGLGNMGRPMALNALSAGYSLRGWDVVSSARAAAAESGIPIASDVVEAVLGATAVVTMLPAGRHVREAYMGDGGILSLSGEGALLIDCSTIDPTTSREMASAASASGRRMIDAPVSGGVSGASAGTLTFMVGGSSSDVDSARPLLDVMGSRTVHAGSSGAGQAAKICNNMLLGISMIGVCEAFALAESLGLASEKLFEASSVSSGQCWSLTSYCPVAGPVPSSPANRDYAAGFTAAMMLKDLLLAREASSSGGVSTPLGSHAAEIYERMASRGDGEVDFSGVIRMLRDEGKG